MTTRLKLTILMAVLIASGAAAILLFHLNPVAVISACFLFGSVGTVNYAYPLAGTVAPTAAQNAPYTTLTAQCITADADTGVIIKHNWALANAADLFPLVSFYVNVLGTAAPSLTATLTDSNTVSVGKATTAGTGCTFTVTLLRPHTILAPGV